MLIIHILLWLLPLLALAAPDFYKARHHVNYLYAINHDTNMHLDVCIDPRSQEGCKRQRT